MSLARAKPLSSLEIASGIVFGVDPASPLPRRDPGLGAVGSLERAILRALRRPPCLVSFSGGRDSSGVLALATRAARREGLPDPVPATARFPRIASADEVNWQALVVSHLGLREWLRLEFEDELDLIGPIATRVMARHGLPYPSNLHLLLPLIERSRGGSLITGIGGDEALSGGSRALEVLAGRLRPTARDLPRIGLALAPRPLRQAVLARRHPLTFPWLYPAANRRLARAYAQELARFPVRWNARARELWRSRYLQLTLEMTAALAVNSNVQVVHPFADAAFVSSLAGEAGARGFRNRTAAMELLFGDVLPLDVQRRRTKASFDGVLWNRYSRAFADELAAGGLDRALRHLGAEEIVDPASLARVWSEPAPPANSFLLLQACWLVSRREDRLDSMGPA